MSTPTVTQSFAKINRLLEKSDVYVVGGTVRDRLLKRPTRDYDLVTSYNPKDTAERIAAELGGRSFVLDLERGVYRIAFPDFQIDLSERQGKSLEDDILRRDFTVNALMVPLTEWGKPSWQKALIDKTHGVRDLREGTLHIIAKGAFKEDPLRVLRAFRLAAELRFSISPKTLAAIKKEKHLLTKPSPERIREELLKLFSTQEAYSALRLMEKTDVLNILLPDAKALRRTGHSYYGKGGVLTHTLESVRHFEAILRTRKSWFPKSHKKIESYLNNTIGGHPRYAHLKWALLLHDIGKPETAKRVGGRLRFFEHEHVGAGKVRGLAKRFRWSQEESQSYERLVRHHMRPGNLATHENVTDKAIHRFFRDLGEDAIAMLLVSLADHLTYLTPRQLKKRSSPHEILTLKMIHRFYHAHQRIVPPKLLNGHDIMRAFDLPPSRLVGDLLRELEEAQCERKFANREEALSYLKGRLEFLKRESPLS